MADDNTIITEVKTFILNFISQVQNHHFTEAANNLHDSITIIKPDGTLVNKNSWIKMITDSNISIILNELLVWNFFQFSENKDTIFCGYTTKFIFNIVRENVNITEKAVFTALLKKTDGQWKIFSLQRTNPLDVNRSIQ